VYLDHLDSLIYAHLQRNVALVLDMHNVYSRLTSRTAAEARGTLRRRYLLHEAALLAKMERRAATMVHTILAVSDEDARYFSDIGAQRVVVVPNGVDCAAYDSLPTAERTGPPTILYVGSLSWLPNLTAVRFLVTEVLPFVRRHAPEARLRIVGKNPPADLLKLAAADDHVEIAENVLDVRPYLRDANILAVPLQAGGGTRLKILEAFAAGLPVVSTRVGCEGIRVKDGEHLVIADIPQFAAAVVQVLRDPNRARESARRSRYLARELYDWGVVGKRTCDAVASAAAQGKMGVPTLAQPPAVPSR
jgi:glycosyltransferase involved in cell wall biosynthesis